MLFILLSLLLCLALVGLVFLVILVGRAMSPVLGGPATGQLAEGLWTVRDGFVNAFLIGDGTSFIAIDAGMAPGGFARQLARLPIDPQAVEAVYFTHADPDHFGAAGLFPRASLVLPADEIPLVTGLARRRMFGLELPLRRAFPQPWQAMAAHETRTHGRTTIRSIPTPGHTPGSTSYLVNGRWLFTGDLLMLRGGRAEPTWPLINNDTAQSRESLRRLATGLDGLLGGVELLVTAHTGSSGDFGAALADWRPGGKRAGGEE
jgi:glyoxylase-like metal-dependent hydrolase (beta-lactamase superfamily II)